MSQGNEGTEEPTEHKLSEARKRGDVPHSRDLSRAASTLLWALALAVAGGFGFGYLGRYVSVLVTVSVGQKGGLPLGWSAVHLGVGLAVLLLIGLCAALLPELAQSRGRLASKRQWFDMNRVNPVQGFKNIFALTRMVLLPLSCMRFAVVAGLALWVGSRILAAVHRISAAPWYAGYQIVWWATLRLLAISAVICMAIGVVDAFVQKALWIKRNRMKKDEIQKESREQEGDPIIKGMRRQAHEQAVR